MIQAIWESIIHSISLWRASVKKGKLLLENNSGSLEPCLLELNSVIIKLRGHQNTLYEEKVKDMKKVVVLAYLEKIIEMFREEFDLKVCISGQVAGTFEKRKMIAYMWVMEAHIDDEFLEGLPSKISD